MDVKHICFIAEGYPTADEPIFTFVRQLICSIADIGIKCSVIVPQSITNSLIRGKKTRPFHWIDTSEMGCKIDIYQPYYVSFSNVKIFNTSLTHYFWRRAIINCFNKVKIKPNVIYGHFWHSGVVAAMLGEKNKLPVFVATGESKITVRELYKDNILSRYIDKVDGVICVSSKNMYESISLDLVSKEKTIVIPNAIDKNIFYFEDKLEVRRQLNFAENDFIVAFTGAFTNRKGVLRLSSALSKVNNVKSIYIGSGEQTPNGEGILFCGKLSHNQIVHYLNAADVFVLPTLAEGCSNAIVEAMACGLPIISSDLPFNNDILSEQNSIRIDSNDIDEIAEAIIFLRDNPQVREKMSKASLLLAKDLDIEIRAKKIVEYIKQKVVEHYVL